jgi:hypothetical protein
MTLFVQRRKQYAAGLVRISGESNTPLDLFVHAVKAIRRWTCSYSGESNTPLDLENYRYSGMGRALALSIQVALLPPSGTAGNMPVLPAWGTSAG